MPRPVERCDDYFRNFLAERLCDVLNVVGNGRIEVYDIRSLRADRYLLHV